MFSHINQKVSARAFQWWGWTYVYIEKSSKYVLPRCSFTPKTGRDPLKRVFCFFLVCILPSFVPLTSRQQTATRRNIWLLAIIKCLLGLQRRQVRHKRWRMRWLKFSSLVRRIGLKIRSCKIRGLLLGVAFPVRDLAFQRCCFSLRGGDLMNKSLCGAERWGMVRGHVAQEVEVDKARWDLGDWQWAHD